MSELTPQRLIKSYVERYGSMDAAIENAMLRTEVDNVDDEARFFLDRCVSTYDLLFMIVRRLAAIESKLDYPMIEMRVTKNEREGAQK